MALNLTHGAVGQLKGPFSQNESFAFIGVKVKLGVSVGEKDFMQFGNPTGNNGFAIRLDNELIRIGRTFLYETDDATDFVQLSFPQGAPASLIVDYVIVEA